MLDQLEALGAREHVALATQDRLENPTTWGERLFLAGATLSLLTVPGIVVAFIVWLR